ncbi:urease accessory protein [Faunimonas pinastri]|uniref:Urease accessory protein UreF n=1 Tax=Faunimonas pinastri TaxID=1855383 RepID=A0A1H9KS10_9HYPH|nr:urease accessory protein UreF [Faunimonas pinastri]SER01819.1 urease accessory protein [Faunimonas pinastri]
MVTAIRTPEPRRDDRPAPEAMVEPLTPERLLKLQTWLSPGFPIGAFSYSHGLEWAIETGTVTDPEALGGWIGELLRRGSARNDAILFAETWRAAAGRNADALREVGELAESLATSRERHLETMAQGTAFLKAVTAAWSTPTIETFAGAHSNRAAYPVAVALATASHAIPLAHSLPAYLHAFVANLVSVAVRLVPLGQTNGLRVVSALTPLVLETARAAEKLTLDDLGSATVRSELFSIQHETQYSRIFRT